MMQREAVAVILGVLAKHANNAVLTRIQLEF